MGIGKTSLASQFPNVLIASFEMGSNALNNKYVQPIQTWNDWRQVVSQLVRKKELQNKFDTIAIDTADSAWELCVKYICSNYGVERLGDMAWGQGFDLAKKEFSSGLRDLAFAGYGLVFISHSTEKTMKDENGEEYVQINPALATAPYNIVNKMVDVIGYIRSIEDEKGNEERYIFFRGDKRFFAKSRFKYIEPKVKFDYEHIVNAIYDAIDIEIEHSGGEATEEVNPYSKINFDELMEEAKILWGKVVQSNVIEKANLVLEQEFGKPTKFSEILPEQVEKLHIVINKIQELV